MISKEIIFREATPDDLSELRDLGLVSFGQFKEILTTENWEKLRSSLSNEIIYKDLLEKSVAFICVKEGKIVGATYFIPSGNPTEIYLSEWSYVRMVGVRPEFSGQGIGKKLMNCCVAHARQTGEKTVALHTSEFMDAARHIYENMGFIRLKEIEPRFGKTYWIYTLAL